MFVFKAAVVGAGSAGAQIEQAIAAAGIPVVQVDGAQGFDRVAASLGDADIVIEAVGDDPELKQAVFEELDARTPGRAILASSGSSLSITEIADATLRPQQVCGLRFSEPVDTTALVEVVAGELTSPETIRSAIAFVQAIRRVPVRSADAPGLILDRVLDAGRAAPQELVEDCRFVEAAHLLEDGLATHRDIDQALAAGVGHDPRKGPLPPFMRADAEGLDIVLERLERLAAHHGERLAAPVVLQRLVSQGRLGRASGQGFYAYPQPRGEQPGETVRLERGEGLAIAWLDNGAVNSISSQVVADLQRAFEIARDGGARALIFASAKPFVFSAGADIRQFAAGDGESIAAMHSFTRALETGPVVTIAAINGLAYGGGLELALACDVRLAARSALLGQPEIKLGLIPGFGGSQRLPRLAGAGRALELMLTGEPFEADWAAETGIVTEVFDDHELFDAARAWARKATELPPAAVAELKALLSGSDLETGLEAEAQAFARVLGSDDAREGIGAFLARRRPRFSGS